MAIKESTYFQQNLTLEIFRTRQLLDRRPVLDGCANQRLPEHVMHNGYYHILLGYRTVDLGRDDDRIRRSHEGILRNRLANFADGHFGREGPAVKNHRLVLAVVNVYCSERHSTVWFYLNGGLRSTLRQL